MSDEAAAPNDAAAALDLSLSTSAEAQRTIAELSGKKEILNHIVSVELAHPLKQQVEDSKHGPPVVIPSKNKIIVKNLALDLIDGKVSVPLIHLLGSN